MGEAWLENSARFVGRSIMTDHTLRQLERDAAQGDPAARVGWLRTVIRGGGCERCGGLGWIHHATVRHGGTVRPPCPDCSGSGNRLRHLVKLLAYCGDEAAREAIGSDLPWKTSDEVLELTHWLRGLDRWELAQERAALATARTWLRCRGHKLSGLRHFDARIALTRVEEWLACQGEAQRTTCMRIGTTQDPCRLVAFYVGLRTHESSDQQAAETRHVVLLVCETLAELTVRQAIRKDLCEWAWKELGL